MKGFGDENYWMERAQRAEAECERLRTMLKEMIRESFDPTDPRYDGEKMVECTYCGYENTVDEQEHDEDCVIVKARKALATPPPAHSDDHD